MQVSEPIAARPSRRKTDPVVKWLVVAIAGVVILWLVTLLSAMLFGVVMPSDTPRTAAEHNLNVLSAEVQGEKVKTETYAKYIGALIEAGQLSKAQTSLDRSLKSVKSDRSYLLAQQARLYLVLKKYDGTVTTADKAMAEAKKELQKFMDANVRANRRPDAGASMPSSYSTAALDKAYALVAMEQWEKAVKAYDIYLVEEPTDSDILVQRARAKIETNDKKGAEADFREALKYVPDFEPALEGLKQIGAAQ